MAEGKNIEIKIAATGGDQAAAEINKVKAAASETTIAPTGFGGMLDGVPERTDEAVTGLKKVVDAVEGSAGLVAATKKAEPALGAVTKSGVDMGTAMKEMATHVNAGKISVSDLGAVLPKVAGAFGPWGLALSAVATVAIPLITDIFDLGEATATAGGKADVTTTRMERLNTALDKQKEKVKETIKTKREADNEAWIKSLDAEEDYYKKINDQLTRQIAHLAKLRALKEGTDSAKREAKIAEIEADPKKTDSQKIREIAGVKDEGARAKADAEKKALDEAAVIAATAATAAQAKADRQTQDAELASKERERLEQEVAALNEKVTAGGVAQKQLPKLEENLSYIKGYLPEFTDTAQADVDAAQKDISAGAGAGSRLPNIEKDLELKRKAEKTQEKEADAARKVAEEAYSSNLYAQALARDGKPQIEERYQIERGGRSIKTNAAAEKADDKEAAEDQKKKDHEAKRKAEEELRKKEEKLKEDAAANKMHIDNSEIAQPPALGGRGHPTGGNAAQVSRDLKSLGSEIGHADTIAKIKAVKDDLKAKSGELGNAMVAALTAMITAQEKQVKSINDLKTRIKNLEGK